MVQKITLMQDGDAWIAHGESFTDLQESDDYAYGDTPGEALKNYLEKTGRSL